jgi:tRNA(fMet)-specific endonuclease VapC
MSGRVLFDTNICIALMEGDPQVAHRMVHTDIYLCVPVIAELTYGALASSRVQHNLLRLEELRSGAVVLDCDLVTASTYAEVKFLLRRKGKPIPGNDVWIAALALQHSLTLITRDAHFKLVDGLKFEKW